MKAHSQRIFYWVTVIVAAVIIQTVWHKHTFSFISWPLVLSVVIIFTNPKPWVGLISLIAASELLSHTPAGILTVAMLLPLLFLRLPHRPVADLTGSFFAFIFIIICAQIAVVSTLLLIANKHMVDIHAAPLPALFMIIPSALGAWAAIIGWQEWVEPSTPNRTIPRYKNTLS